MRRIFVAALGLMFLSSATAFAGQAAYSADDIIKFFNDQVADRGICVGTEEECGIAAEKPRSFDLRVNFDYNSDKLTSEAKANLTAFATAINSSSLLVARFAVEGYTDATGDDDYNLSLSERRAEAVVAYLKSLGVDSLRLYAKGFGETTPVGADPFDPINRRVETRLVR